jgi:hypothetical protein
LKPSQFGHLFFGLLGLDTFCNNLFVYLFWICNRFRSLICLWNSEHWWCPFRAVDCFQHTIRNLLISVVVVNASTFSILDCLSCVPKLSVCFWTDYRNCPFESRTPPLSWPLYGLKTFSRKSFRFCGKIFLLSRTWSSFGFFRMVVQTETLIRGMSWVLSVFGIE